jgi:outer membrane receptor for monomeric catechols
MTMNDHRPGPEEPTSARSMPTDRAVEAGERLLDAGSKVGNAYADAYQDAVVSIADFREKLSDSGVMDWRELVQAPSGIATGPLAEPLLEAGKAMTRVNEQVLDAGKQLGLACVDACEQAVLCALDLGEQAGAASDAEWMRSVTSAHVEVARDVTRAYGEVARRMLA